MVSDVASLMPGVLGSGGLLYTRCTINEPWSGNDHTCANANHIVERFNPTLSMHWLAMDIHLGSNLCSGNPGSHIFQQSFMALKVAHLRRTVEQQPLCM